MGVTSDVNPEAIQPGDMPMPLTAQANTSERGFHWGTRTVCQAASLSPSAADRALSVQV